MILAENLERNRFFAGSVNGLLVPSILLSSLLSASQKAVVHGHTKLRSKKDDHTSIFAFSTLQQRTINVMTRPTEPIMLQKVSEGPATSFVGARLVMIGPAVVVVAAVVVVVFATDAVVVVVGVVVVVVVVVVVDVFALDGT